MDTVYSGKGISIHSVARPRPSAQHIIPAMSYFNPLGRKTETFPTFFRKALTYDFNPLGRKTETL